MKSSFFSFIVLSAGAVLLQAQPAAEPTQRAAPADASAVSAEQGARDLLANFDANHDGILNEAELSRALASVLSPARGAGPSLDGQRGSGGRNGAQSGDGNLAQNDPNQQPGGEGQRGGAQQPGQRGAGAPGGAQPGDGELAQNDPSGQPGGQGRRGGGQQPGGQPGERGGGQRGGGQRGGQGGAGQQGDLAQNDPSQPGRGGGGNQPGDPSQRGGGGQRAGQPGQRGGNGGQLAQNGGNRQSGAAGGGGNFNNNGGGAFAGNAVNNLGALTDAFLNNNGLPAGPITGDNYVDWADRLRIVEQLVDDPSLRQQITNVRANADDLRRAYTQRGTAPQWGDVQSSVLAPLTAVRAELAKELARRTQPDSLQPADRDPVPEKYADAVRSYYEALGGK